jgi:hypothetical protein
MEDSQLKILNQEKEQNRLMASVINDMVKLDFLHLVILNTQLGEHIFNCLQHAEIERLRLSEATDENNSDSQPLPQKKGN